RFAADSRENVFRPGVGLVGTAWAGGEPLWIPDASKDRRTMRGDLPLATDWRGAGTFPVKVGGHVRGVLAFASQRLRPPHKRLQQALQVVATMLGQFLERADAEHAVRDSEARFRSLTNLSSDMYWEQDESYRFTQLEGRLVNEGDRQLSARLL